MNKNIFKLLKYIQKNGIAEVVNKLEKEDQGTYGKERNFYESSDSPVQNKGKRRISFSFLLLLFSLVFMKIIYITIYYNLDLDCLNLELDLIKLYWNPLVSDSDKIKILGEITKKDPSKIILSLDFMQFIQEIDQNCNLSRNLKRDQVTGAQKIILDTFPFFIDICSSLLFLKILISFGRFLIKRIGNLFN